MDIRQPPTEIIDIVVVEHYSGLWPYVTIHAQMEYTAVSSNRTVKILTPLNHSAYTAGLLTELGLTRRQFLCLLLDALCAPTAPSPLAPHLGTSLTNSYPLMRYWADHNDEKVTPDIHYAMCSQAQRWNRSNPDRYRTDAQITGRWKDENKLCAHTPHHLRGQAVGVAAKGMWDPRLEGFDLQVRIAQMNEGKAPLDLWYVGHDGTIHKPATAEPRRRLLGRPRDGGASYFEVKVPPRIKSQLDQLSMAATQDPFNRFATYLWLWAHDPSNACMPAVAAKLAAFADHAAGENGPNNHWHHIWNGIRGQWIDPHDLTRHIPVASVGRFFWNL